MIPEDFLKIIEQESLRAEQEFSDLTKEQLNWKPEPTKWSIGQCLHHLITTNSTYSRIFELIIKNQFRSDLWGAISPFSNLLGNYLIRTLGPERRRNYKAPSIFKPTQSEINKDIVTSFTAHNSEMIALINQIIRLRKQHIIIHSPASKFITYKVIHAIAIIARHEQRHLQQALEIKRLFSGSYML